MLVMSSRLSWWLMLSGLATRLHRSILDCALGRLGLPPWFPRVYLAYHNQVRLRCNFSCWSGRALVL